MMLEEMDPQHSDEKTLRRRFNFTVLVSFVDKDILDKWTRPEDVRHLSYMVRKIYQRINPDYDESLTIDHINRDCFDNRRENLRLATQSQQVNNRRQNRNNTSGHVGVAKKIEVIKSKRKTLTYEYWFASKQKGSVTNSKRFPFTDEGLLQACKFYREVLLADGSQCANCHPECYKEGQIEDKSSIVTKTFSYELLCSREDEDLFEKWTRADDVRRGHIMAQKICERIYPKPGEEYSVDHINRNCFDNQRTNLRWATPSEQSTNRRTPRHNSSGHQGVYKYKGKWKAERQSNGRKVSKSYALTNLGLSKACAQYRKWRGDGSVCETCESTYTISTIGNIIEETENYITFLPPSRESSTA